MNTEKTAAGPGAGEWETMEARLQHAKQVLLDARQRHGDAARELLRVRAQARRMLETLFPGAEAAPSRPVSEMHCDCDDLRAGSSGPARRH